VQVIVLDGSLLYRGGPPWHVLGETFRTWLDYVRAKLMRELAFYPRLHTLVYTIDMYGPNTIPAVPKEAIQEHRYEKKKELAEAREVFQPDAPTDGVSSTDTFGFLDSRMALNEMFSQYILAVFERMVQGQEPITLSRVIADGVVVNGETLTLDIRADGKGRRPYDGVTLRHAESDVRMPFWCAVFATSPVVVHSCDIDMITVMLYHMRRLSAYEQHNVNDVYIHKMIALSTGVKRQMINMKVFFRLVNTLFRQYNFDPARCSPVDIFAVLFTLGGNDFCDPWGASEKIIKTGERNDGVRLTAIWQTYILEYASIGPLVLPATESDRYRGREYGVLKCPIYVYPVQVVVESVHRLVCRALERQLTNTRLRCNNVRAVLCDEQYAHAQVRRTAWALYYYANAALPDVVIASGLEHGWRRNDKGVVCTCNEGIPWLVAHSGARAEDSPTPPPSPVVHFVDRGEFTQSVLEQFEQLNLAAEDDEMNHY